MTRRLLLLPLLAVLLGISWVAARPDEALARTSVSVSVSYFYNDLAPYGSWVDYSSYGYCWAPAHVSRGWRPYSNGYWAYTDFGWTWVSDEPWAWAAYHYGRWVFDPDYGWLWVPGNTWGPAWVAWRESDDWCGWAPLPPGNVASFTFTSYSSSRIPSDYWCFVPTRNLCDRDVRYRIRPASNNVVLFRRTSDATRFSMRNGGTVNLGVSRSFIERRTGRPVRQMRVVDAGSPSRGRGRFVGQDQVAFYRPTVRWSRDTAPRVEERLAPQERGGGQRSSDMTPREQWNGRQRSSDVTPREQWNGRQRSGDVTSPQESTRPRWREGRQSNDEAYRQREQPQRETPPRQWREQPQSRPRFQEGDPSANRGNPQADRSPRWGRQSREPKPEVKQQPPQQGQRDRSDVSRNAKPKPDKSKKQPKDERWGGD